MTVAFNLEDIKADDYNFIISNLILSKAGNFTYYDVRSQLVNMFGEIDNKIEYTLKQCLIRLRDDGFLNILGSNYSVTELKI